MTGAIFETKFEVGFKDENILARKLGLEFQKEYTDVDFYLRSHAGKTLKIKHVGKGAILYEVVFEGGVFRIAGRDITEKEKEEVLRKHPINLEINRRKRAYLLEKIQVKMDFDYMQQFPGRLFLEAYSGDKRLTLKAKEYLQGMGLGETIKVPYDELLLKR